MTTPQEAPPTPTAASVRPLVEAVSRRIPPLWPLQNFVAVNPFVGLSDLHFVDAALLLEKVGPGQLLMSAEYYQGQLRRGALGEADFHAALAELKANLPKAWAAKIPFTDWAAWQAALGQAPDGESRPGIRTVADLLEVRTRTRWAAFVLEEISKWCSAYYDQGQSSWRMPWRHLGLYAAWKSAAERDANPEWMGLANFRKFAAALPGDHWTVVAAALGQLGVLASQQPDFLHRQWMSLAGWSSYVQYRVREHQFAGQADDALAQLLAIRLAYDLALWQQFGNDQPLCAEWLAALTPLENPGDTHTAHFLARLVAQHALEGAYRRRLIAQIRAGASAAAPVKPPRLQAAFCIDVRSEVFRRALEAQSEAIETIGFAGFFGMPIEYVPFGRAAGQAQCPVLLTPRFKVRETCGGTGSQAQRLRWFHWRQQVNEAWNSFKMSAISCFAFVETAGLWFGVKLVQASLALAPAESISGGSRRAPCFPRIDPEECSAEAHGFAGSAGIGLTDQIALAAGALKHMGLVSNFANLVLLCGHGSETANNPYASALDCGACGGHAGHANARVAADILNRPEVRQGLLEQGIAIPAGTRFLAALHNTTTDDVRLYVDEPLTLSQAAELRCVEAWLRAASRQARRERAAALGLAARSDAALEAALSQRSRDWSQVRPEWGLAGNAAFIAAPRVRTQGGNLSGRAFLHDYHAALDRDKSTLELILTAPMVVASWINLQYYASTVDNRLFGSGNKVLHNVVGTLGVWQGNGGDLQAGLPLQSLHDGARWVHEPLRLSVFIEAARADLAAILAKHPDVRQLVSHGWVHLFAVEDQGRLVFPWLGNGFATSSL